MNEPLGTTETSMEAILASIRRIIAEDQIQPPPGVRLAPLPRPEPVEQTSPEILPPDPPSSPPPAEVETAPSVAFKPVIVTPPSAPAPAAPPPPTAEPVVPQTPSSVPEPSAAPEPAAPSAVSGVLGGHAAAGEELVLTQMVAVDGTVVALGKRGISPARVLPPSSAPLDVLLLTDALPRPAPKLASDSDRPRVGLAAPEPLVTPAAVLEQLSRVRGQGPAPANPLAGAIGVSSLEELVRQSLEPKIQEWLNANLLEIVERLVQQEIDKISRRT